MAQAEAARRGHMPRRKQDPEGSSGGRERLLRAAVHQFAAKGYAATTVRGILREAGVSAPVLYYHFGSKEGLFLALVREGAGKLEAAAHAALTRPGDAATRIRGYCRAIAEVRREYANLTWTVEAILSGPREAAPRFDFVRVFTDSLQRLEDLVRQGVASGELRPCDPRHAALACLGAVEMTARMRTVQPTGVTDDDDLDAMLSLILDGLAAGRR